MASSGGAMIRLDPRRQGGRRRDPLRSVYAGMKSPDFGGRPSRMIALDPCRFEIVSEALTIGRLIGATRGSCRARCPGRSSWMCCDSLLRRRGAVPTRRVTPNALGARSTRRSTSRPGSRGLQSLSRVHPNSAARSGDGHRLIDGSCSSAVWPGHDADDRAVRRIESTTECPPVAPFADEVRQRTTRPGARPPTGASLRRWAPSRSAPR